MGVCFSFQHKLFYSSIIPGSIHGVVGHMAVKPFHLLPFGAQEEFSSSTRASISQACAEGNSALNSSVLGKETRS